MARGRMFAGVVDSALELSVIGGFSRIGPLVRSRVENWTEPPSLAGRVCLVTGGGSGLGLAASVGWRSGGRRSWREPASSFTRCIRAGRTRRA